MRKRRRRKTRRKGQRREKKWFLPLTFPEKLHRVMVKSQNYLGHSNRSPLRVSPLPVRINKKYKLATICEEKKMRGDTSIESEEAARWRGVALLISNAFGLAPCNNINSTSSLLLLSVAA